jgi:hypothetical protein
MDQRSLLRLIGATSCAVVLTSKSIAAQRLAPVTDDQRCGGQRISAITLYGSRREIVDRRFGPLATVANGVLFAVQPQTHGWLLRRFLLLSPGQTCDEQRRAESERILRAQPYISDAAIRAIPDSSGGVELRVETIDEISVSVQAWGLHGVPAGFDVGTGNLAGTGRSLDLTAEIGRGNAIGGGARIHDTQFLGQPINFDAAYSDRPEVRTRRIVIERPFLTNFQRDSWFSTIDDNSSYYSFQDPVVHAVSMQYHRRRWELTYTRQVVPPAGALVLGFTVQGERADGVRTVFMGEDGPVEVPTPDPLRRYSDFSSGRVGATAGVRKYRFIVARGLQTLSAPEDVPLGAELFGSVLTGIPAWQQGGHDHTFIANTAGAVGNAAVLLRWRADGSWDSPRAGVFDDRSGVSAKTGLFLTAGRGDRTTVEGSAVLQHNDRVPSQLTFRGDDDGLLGYRTTGFGGGRRFLVGAEQRQRVWSPIPHVEMAVAALAQVGKLEAGDAPYGVNTDWRAGAGAALLIAIPAGSRQALRIEYGRALNPLAGQRRAEWRFVYSDLSGHF